jgi:hypothetical protein
MRSLPTALALTLALSPALAGDRPLEERAEEASIRRHLGYTIFKSRGRTRGIAETILAFWRSGTRFSENATGQWIVANKGGVMVNGKAYDALPGAPTKVVMGSDGNWIASTPEAFMHSGNRFEDPETVAQVHQDVYAFQTIALGNAAPSKSPLRAGPNLAPRSQSFQAPRNMTVDRFDMPDQFQPFLAPNQASTSRNITLDTEPPFVRRVLITRHPEDQVQRRSGFPPRFFVGLAPVEFQILMSETMGTAPRVEVVQADGTRTPAALSQDQNPLYTFRWFPFASPEGNGPATLEVLGDTQNTPPQFGADQAGNVIPAQEDVGVFTGAVVVDTLPPELMRIDTTQPGSFRTIPGEDEVLSRDEFPRSVLAFVEDYDQPQDPGGVGPLTVQDASGVHFRRIGDGTGAMDMRVFKPDGSEIPGTLSSRINALELFLPDVYDPGVGIFQDRNQDGFAEPDEGTYRVQVDLVDEVGNTSSVTLPFGADTTPIAARALQVSVQPILSDPFPNPPDPLPEGGDVFVRRLDGVVIRSQDPDFSFPRSTVKVQSLAAGRFTVPQDLVGEFSRGDDFLRFDIARDQDGDGRDDFENPEPGQFLPPGMTDPRLGKNDGHYRVVVTARDQAGNESEIKRDIVLDTQPPEVGSAFPSTNTTQYAPLRMVDVQLTDPQNRAEEDGSGVRLTASQINLRFLGNDQTQAQDIRGLPFLHTPNPDDPTRPDFNPVDTSHRLLLELIDEQGNVTKLPDDGTFDGIYQIDVVVRDQAGNEAMGTTTFEYSSVKPEEPTTDDEMGQQPPPQVMMTLVRP